VCARVALLADEPIRLAFDTTNAAGDRHSETAPRHPNVSVASSIDLSIGPYGNKLRRAPDSASVNASEDSGLTR
jgi:hypothetical protein